ncbi:helix-turn-helix domain-containing protein [Microvirga sp. VF16]|uniref:helix-turn-helix domain-containing protein n=1 Tax=Microvirga sp. VF16 TaxID=2807101 RepID=UPI00193CB160|nr:helix-turn-helix domain-containing protein [Microvirga sp. VF16]QRM32446.1 helix-turn-helix domain-containing protein [Microvirga sp. VF16]
MQFQRGFVSRLYPDSGQEVLLRQGIGVCRLVDNVGLKQRRDHDRKLERSSGGKLNDVAQARKLTALRREFA